jgi:D-3-phosphoglycerate dehydrogenase
MPHVLIAGKIHEEGVNLLKSAKGFTFELVNEVSVESFLPFLGKADAIILRTQPFTAVELAKAPHLKIVSRHGVGFDAVDGQALAARGIPLTVVGDVNSRAVAEHTLMLMLATARRTVAHDQASRGGQWNIRNRFETTELDGKSLLLVGYGRIGRRVAQLAQAFGMTVMAHDPFAKDLQGVEAVADIDFALPRADYLSLHVPAIKDGPVIGARQLSLMKPSATLINAARGGLVDEMALDQALRDGRLAAAGLDVFIDEPPEPGNPLLANPKVTISPHAAGLTDECTARMAVSAVTNIFDHFAGRLDRSLVVNKPW